MSFVDEDVKTEMDEIERRWRIYGQQAFQIRET